MSKEFKETLREILKGNYLIVCLGNELRGDDAVGTYIANLLSKRGLGEKVLNLGMSPEAIIGSLRGNYERLIFIDAISAGLPPGTIVFGELEELEKRPILVTTHSIPLSLIVKYLRLTIPSLEAYLIGIQVKSVDIGAKLSEEVLRAAHEVVELITSLLQESINENRKIKHFRE